MPMRSRGASTAIHNGIENRTRIRLAYIVCLYFGVRDALRRECMSVDDL